MKKLCAAATCDILWNEKTGKPHYARAVKQGESVFICWDCNERIDQIYGHAALGPVKVRMVYVGPDNGVR